MIKPCPECGDMPEYVERVEVVEDPEPPIPVSVSDGDDVPRRETIDTIDCRRYRPCGHAFTRASLDRIRDGLAELRSLDREMRSTISAERMRALKEWIIPAQKNAVNDATHAAERIERAELVGS